MKDHSTTAAGRNSPGRHETPRRPGQPGEEDQRRAGPSPLSQHATGPHPPYEGYERDGAAAIKHVPAEQLDTKHAPGGAVSAKPVVLSNDEASLEGGARERNADSKREP